MHRENPHYRPLVWALNSLTEEYCKTMSTWHVLGTLFQFIISPSMNLKFSFSYMYLSGPSCIQYYNPATFLYATQQSLSNSLFPICIQFVNHAALCIYGFQFVFIQKFSGLLTERSKFIAGMEVMLPETSFLASRSLLEIFCIYWRNRQLSFWWMARIVTVPHGWWRTAVYIMDLVI
jgi:hypothetical protein